VRLEVRRGSGAEWRPLEFGLIEQVNVRFRLGN